MTLLTKKVLIRWNTRNILFYETKGFSFTKIGDEFECEVINVADSYRGIVEVQCDYCERKIERKYKDHMTIQKNNVLNKDSCTNCQNLKNKEILEYKQKNNLLTKADKGYWTFKENRMFELDKYIIDNSLISNLYVEKNFKSIYWNFKSNDHDIVDAIDELGYNSQEILGRMPLFYFDDFENIKSRIQIFTDKHSRFPLIQEIINELKISDFQIAKHGGIYEIKRKMGFRDRNDLVDASGFYNSSYYEYLTAQFLINNNIPYAREQHPFPDEYNNYRSDFTLYPVGGEIIHVEVWGYGENNGKIPKSYKKVKNNKMSLYSKFNISVISIEKDVFLRKSIECIQNKLYEIFKTYLTTPFLKLDSKVFIKPNSFTDDELLEKILKYSHDINKLPTVTVLKENKQYGLYEEVIKRYGSYYSFATKYNLKTSKREKYWTDDLILEEMQKLLDVDSDINSSSIDGLNVIGLRDAIYKRGGMTYFKNKLLGQYTS